MKVTRPWIHGPIFDSFLILGPSLFAVLFVALTHESYPSLPLWMWVVFVMGIDVSHVYSTLFKTYFHKEEFEKRKTLLLMAPVVVFILGVFLHTLSSSLFWTILAYLAVFHFIRQQYGFMRLYDRGSTSFRRLDEVLVYALTLYPVIYWHCHPRDFHWFMEGDFISGWPVLIERIAFFIYLAIIGLYLFSQFKRDAFNLPKNLLIAGTGLSWYAGIVWFNGDAAFTITNVVAHGIPYMALIWSWGRKKEARPFTVSWGIPVFLLSLLFLAVLEESLWAGLVWREHLNFFSWSDSLPAIKDKDTLSLVVPLLTLPQATHYFLDGFIWKSR